VELWRRGENKIFQFRYMIFVVEILVEVENKNYGDSLSFFKNIYICTKVTGTPCVGREPTAPCKVSFSIKPGVRYRYCEESELISFTASGITSVGCANVFQCAVEYKIIIPVRVGNWERPGLFCKCYLF